MECTPALRAKFSVFAFFLVLVLGGCSDPATLGLELAPDARGKGIGTQALIAGAQWAFAHGAHRVEGSTEESNIAMRRAFEKAGWKFEGVLRALFLEDGVPHDYYSYAITKFD